MSSCKKPNYSVQGRACGHVIEAAWAPDATALLTGPIENMCMVWIAAQSISNEERGLACRGGHADDVIDAARAPDATALLRGP